MSLKDDLTDIQGVGDATADKIMTVFEDYQSEPEAVEAIEKALEYFDQGDYTYGEKFLRRVVE